ASGRAAGRAWRGQGGMTGLAALRAAWGGVGRTHQIGRPFANLTIFEKAVVAAVQGSGLDHAGARALARETLEFAGLAARRNEYPAGLTLAGRKRLEMARALACAPKVLLLDEVIAGVNPAEAQEMVTLILRIRD